MLRYAADFIGVRPCERQNFPNFSFSRVLEMFGFWSSVIYLEISGFFELAKISQKSSEKVQKLKFLSNDMRETLSIVVRVEKSGNTIMIYLGGFFLVEISFRLLTFSINACVFCFTDYCRHKVNIYLANRIYLKQLPLKCPPLKKTHFGSQHKN